jgi:hypothetical protein
MPGSMAATAVLTRPMTRCSHCSRLSIRMRWWARQSLHTQPWTYAGIRAVLQVIASGSHQRGL